MKSSIELLKADSFTADEAGTLTLANDADPRDAALDGVHTVVLQFPAFTDGRAFSQAFLLRRRLGFAGQIRAVGDVLIDQLLQMQRSGFTQAVLRADQSVEHGRQLLAQYDAYYQGDAVDTRPPFRHGLNLTEPDTMSTLDLAHVNAEFGRDAPALVEWALGLGQAPIVTTNFRPFEAVILHLVTRVNPDVPVVWMDNGYNTEATYRFADEVTKQLKLNLKIYLPRRSRAHREAVEGATPALDDPRHAAFTEEVKLEPFARALRETAPKVWFTALRATDTAVRAQMDPVSINPDGLIKVAPLLHWTSKDLYQYCEAHGLPNNFDYVDPTKGEDNRECGLHLAH